MGKFRAAAGLAAIAVASLGLAGAAALAATTHSGAAGVTRGMPAQARAAADRVPGTATVYVANAGSGTVTPIAIADNRAGPAIKVGDNPLAIAITPDGKTVYVANWDAGTVTPISTATNKPGHAIRTGTRPFAIAITP